MQLITNVSYCNRELSSMATDFTKIINDYAYYDISEVRHLRVPEAREGKFSIILASILNSENL